jgi:hypothetical protein
MGFHKIYKQLMHCLIALQFSLQYLTNGSYVKSNENGVQYFCLEL